MDGQTKISKADSAEIIKPQGVDVTIFRSKAADGSGVYYGKLPSGALEIIGGPTIVSNKGIAAKITEIAPLNGMTRLKVEAANISHGVAPYTYLWEVASAFANSPDVLRTGPVNATFEAPSINGVNNTDTIALNAATADHLAIGEIRCKITDAQGEVCYATYFYLAAPAVV